MKNLSSALGLYYLMLTFVLPAFSCTKFCRVKLINFVTIDSQFACHCGTVLAGMTRETLQMRHLCRKNSFSNGNSNPNWPAMYMLAFLRHAGVKSWSFYHNCFVSGHSHYSVNYIFKKNAYFFQIILSPNTGDFSPMQRVHWEEK